MTMEFRRPRKYPLDFRAKETDFVMRCWKAANSCSLVGVGSVGKSNLLQHLADTDVHRHYLDQTRDASILAIIIDPSMIGPLPESGANRDAERCWAGYELMMHRIIMAIVSRDLLPEADVRELYSFYDALQNGNNPLYAYMGLRYFEFGLNLIIERLKTRIVFMFDEFEDMLKLLPVKFFLTLRGLRDANRSYITYLTFTRSPMLQLVERTGISLQEIEPFTELFTDNVWYVGPYNDNDARRMADNLMSRTGKNYPSEALEFLVWSTGGYAGLLRSTFHVMDGLGQLDSTNHMNNEAVALLVQRQSIIDECKRMWDSLLPAEHDVLRTVAGLQKLERRPDFDSSVTLLSYKKLLRINPERTGLTIQPPIFRQYIQANAHMLQQAGSDSQ